MPLPSNNNGVVDEINDLPVADQNLNWSPMDEVGLTGLKRAAGILDEEFLPALRGRQSVKVFREMSQNDPIVGALLFTIDKLLRNVVWHVNVDENTAEQEQAKQFIEECMQDMSHTWDDMISEILSMLPYGFSWHEIVYKKRVGPQEKDPKKRSKFTDGKFGWRKIPIRAQETMFRWIFDADGGVKAMIQMSPPSYTQMVIPIEKSLLFRTGIHKGNPEGYSILRNAYRPWFFKKRLEEFEAIGVERDLAGMPVAWVPSSYMNAKQGTKEYRTYQAFKRMAQNVRRDEHDGLVLPIEYDENGKELFRFELMSSGGSRTFDTNSLIQRYEQRILMAALADFILVGHEGTGSYAMHVDKTGIFRTALNSIADSIADVFNRYAIPRLFEINGMKLDTLPKLVPSNVDSPNLGELAQFMTSMGGLGMSWFPDPDLEEYLRNVAQLPELPEDVMEQRRIMAMHQHAIEASQSQMELQGAAQKEDMVNSGHSPEQAEMAAQGQTPQMAANDVTAQYKGQFMAQQDPDVKAQMESERQAQADPEKAKLEVATQQTALQQQADAEKFGRDRKAAKEDHDRSESAKKGDHKRTVALEKLKDQIATKRAKEAASKPKPKDKKK